MKIKQLFQSVSLAATVLAGVLISGCASAPNPDADPYQKFNRKMFKFNDVIDKAVYRPLAKTYEFVLPKFVRRGVHNVIGNVNQVPIIVNDTLQLNIPLAMQDLGRLAVNTTLGIGGWFDVAKHMGAPRHDQDFGITLALWGWKDSNYLLLPFFPVGTPRDLIGLYVDYTYLLPWAYINDTWATYAIYGVIFVDKRASFLSADKLIGESFDPYIFVRDAYMQNRRKQIAAMMQPYGADETLPSLDADANKVAKEANEPPPLPNPDPKTGLQSSLQAPTVAVNQSKTSSGANKASKIEEKSTTNPEANPKNPAGAAETDTGKNESDRSIRQFSPKNIADKQQAPTAIASVEN